MLTTFFKQISNIIKNDYKFFFSKPNVEGIAVGYKYINGISTCKPSIHIFVTKKTTSNCLPCNGLIPSLYKGICTDIIETGSFTTKSNLTLNNSLNSCFLKSSSYTKKIRPIEPSYCMGLSDSLYSIPLTGTFGYIVTDNLQFSKTYCLLSVNKTFADFNNALIGSKIIQPSLLYDGNPNTDTVAALLRFFPLKFSNKTPRKITDFNTIDASIASLVNVGQVQLINPYIPQIGIPTGTIFPSVFEKIQWTGCYSGHRTGIINSLHGIIKVSYTTGNAWFTDVTLASGSCLPQDHGSLVCNNEKKALGLLFGSSHLSICICNIDTISKLLNVTLLTL